MAFEQESILSCLTCFGTNLRSLRSNQKDTKVSIYVSLAKYSMAQFKISLKISSHFRGIQIKRKKKLN